METITNNKNRCPTLRLQQAGRSADAIVSGSASLFSNNIVNANTVLDQIFSTDFCFREIRIRAVTAGSDYRPCHSIVVQLERVIESRLEHGRGPTIILRCPQDDDHVCRARLIASCEITNLAVEVK